MRDESKDVLHGYALCVPGVNTEVHIGGCGVHTLAGTCVFIQIYWQSCFRQGPPRFYRRGFGSSQTLASVWLTNGTDFSRAPAAEAERM